jgi:signal transduction histidine kinase
VNRKDEFGLLARSFNTMADRVEATIVALRRFVADAAHELHTPLTALRTDLELAIDPAAARTALLDRAQAHVARLQTLTSGLLDLSQIEAGEARREQSSVNLTHLVQEISEIYASRAEQKDVTFILDAPDDPLTVTGNDAQLRRALGNLLDNAIKFTSRGGTVQLGLNNAGEWIELKVEDTGIGIPADDLPQLFNRFHRGRNASPYPGSGLGLAIVKAIVACHGGQVMVENVSPGARFSIRLPKM